MYQSAVVLAFVAARARLLPGKTHLATEAPAREREYEHDDAHAHRYETVALNRDYAFREMNVPSSFTVGLSWSSVGGSQTTKLRSLTTCFQYTSLPRDGRSK
jgi:hypothetical protein